LFLEARKSSLLQKESQKELYHKSTFIQNLFIRTLNMLKAHLQKSKELTGKGHKCDSKG